MFAPLTQKEDERSKWIVQKLVFTGVLIDYTEIRKTNQIDL